MAQIVALASELFLGSHNFLTNKKKTNSWRVMKADCKILKVDMAEDIMLLRVDMAEDSRLLKVDMADKECC